MSKEIKIKYGSNELSFRASYIEGGIHFIPSWESLDNIPEPFIMATLLEDALPEGLRQCLRYEVDDDISGVKFMFNTWLAIGVINDSLT